MRFLTIAEVQFLHERILAQSGGMPGIRSQDALESALAQPFMIFGGQELYPTITEKAAALGFSLIMNHPFVDGNKRIGHAVMETFLILNYLVAENLKFQSKFLVPRKKSAKICQIRDIRVLFLSV